MKVAVFNTKSYDRDFLSQNNGDARHELSFFEVHLNATTALLARDFPAVCVFVNDVLNKSVLEQLARQGTKLIALRCAGFNNVDLESCRKLGITVVRVPAYSPYAVAEHAITLILSLNRRITRSYARVREGNFSLEGLLGFDLHEKTVGVIGTGKIGEIFCKIMRGFGCHVLAYDVVQNAECLKNQVQYVGLDQLYKEADIISLHCPLTPETRHIIDEKSLAKMKRGVMLINTGRGALVDTAAVICALKSGAIGFLGIDVYEEESNLFFEDLSGTIIQDDVFMRLLTFPNVLITGHQGFFTQNALQAIAQMTLNSISEFEKTGTCKNKI